MFATINKGVDGLVRLSALIGTIGLVAVVAIILVDVIGRYFGFPLRGGQDLTQMGMVIIVFGGMALCDKLNGHVNVDLFEKSMPHWMVRAGDILSTLLGIFIFSGIAWTTWMSIYLMRFQLNIIQKTNIVALQFDWFKAAIIVLSVITVLGMILKLIGLIFAPRVLEEAV